MEAQLPAYWRDIAEQHGLVPANVPAQLGAKVTDMRVPLRTVLYRVGTNCSLKTERSRFKGGWCAEKRKAGAKATAKPGREGNPRG